ncbi:phosphoglycolate phosphatase [Pleomorphomonas sp. NRK KF1]|uniref:phosphoglycolate phosphatase n=1 Tax=Pleomorphomonas sp. NRK KF1 TaxID=2943000 RepID=UPI002042D46A|nr:phosphoglycolate phosphatase [Pleomorphomonas sp. NRK KF1]MCM5551601.1 phosphoglycolate phosphatase [Pleomorphomonas sp. NRK KF1]
MRPVVVFDLDGTLLDTGPDLLRALNRILDGEGLSPLRHEEVALLFGHGARALIGEGFRRAGRPLDAARLSELVERFIAFYAAEIAVDTRPYPGLGDALAGLSRRGFGLAVCTNKREALAHAVLEGTGLARFFGAVIGGDSLPEQKPHPRPLIEAIVRAGGTPNAAVMIGDSETDIATARAARVPVVAVTFGYGGRPATELGADAVISHYDELDRAIELLLSC